MTIENKFPSETIDLSSKGWFYPEGHPLSNGQVDLYYMTAKHEDILTSKNLIQKGIAIDKVLEALIVNPSVKLDDVLLGDKDAMMIASRVLGYGKDYPIALECPSCSKKVKTTIDLTNIEDKKCPYFTDEFKGRNAFTFTLPLSKKIVTFKFLTQGDEKAIQAELSAIKKISKGDMSSRESTTRIRKCIIAIDGDEDGETIRQTIESSLVRDIKALRDHIKISTPDIDLSTDFTCENCEHEGRVEIPMDVTFFWPDAAV